MLVSGVNSGRNGYGVAGYDAGAQAIGQSGRSMATDFGDQAGVKKTTNALSFLPQGPGGASQQAPYLQVIQQIMRMVMSLLNMLMQKSGEAGKDNGAGGDAKGSGAAGVGDAKMKNVGGKMAVPVDGPGKFLFKPVSESDGKLAIISPRGAQSIVLKDASGRVVESGRHHSSGDLGEIFRFKRPGGNYPGPLTVEVRGEDGKVKTYNIGDPSKRHD